VINSTNQFMGFDGFIWFQGVVESREDPLYLGRMKVRILGIHSENKSDLPTKDLPWAYPVMPITSASMNGIGQNLASSIDDTNENTIPKCAWYCQSLPVIARLNTKKASVNTDLKTNFKKIRP